MRRGVLPSEGTIAAPVAPPLGAALPNDLLEHDQEPGTGEGCATTLSIADPVVPHPSERLDVFFRPRRPDGYVPSSWWNVGAFLVASILAIIFCTAVPDGL